MISHVPALHFRTPLCVRDALQVEVARDLSRWRGRARVGSAAAGQSNSGLPRRENLNCQTSVRRSPGGRGARVASRHRRGCNQIAQRRVLLPEGQADPAAPGGGKGSVITLPKRVNRETVTRAGPPNTADFEEFYATHFQSLTVQLVAYTNDLAAAQDVVQEAFCRALARWQRVAAFNDPAAWVRRVAWNLATSRWRQARTAARFARTHRDEHVAAPSPDRVALGRALDLLPAAHRRAVILHYLADLPISEIARQTHVRQLPGRSGAQCPARGRGRGSRLRTASQAGPRHCGECTGDAGRSGDGVRRAQQRPARSTCADCRVAEPHARTEPDWAVRDALDTSIRVVISRAAGHQRDVGPSGTGPGVLPQRFRRLVPRRPALSGRLRRQCAPQPQRLAGWQARDLGRRREQPHHGRPERRQPPDPAQRRRWAMRRAGLVRRRNTVADP